MVNIENIEEGYMQIFWDEEHGKSNVAAASSHKDDNDKTKGDSDIVTSLLNPDEEWRPWRL